MDGPTIYFFSPIEQKARSHASEAASSFIMQAQYIYIMTVKFGFSEKARKFEKIFNVLLLRASCSVRATAYLSKS